MLKQQCFGAFKAILDAGLSLDIKDAQGVFLYGRVIDEYLNNSNSFCGDLIQKWRKMDGIPDELREELDYIFG